MIFFVLTWWIVKKYSIPFSIEIEIYYLIKMCINIYMNMLMNINRERFNSFFEVFGGLKAAEFEDTALHQSILFQFIKQSTQGHLVL